MAASIRKQRNPEITTRWRSAGAYTFASLALILALGSYHPQDPSLNTFSSPWMEPQNVLGYFGSWTADIFYQLFGYAAWLWPLLWGSTLIRWMAQDKKDESVFRARDWGGLALALSAGDLFIHLLNLLINLSSSDLGFPPQGLLGIALSSATIPFFGVVGTYFVAGFLTWLFCIMWWEELPIYMVRFARKAIVYLWSALRQCFPDKSETTPNINEVPNVANVVSEPAKSRNKNIFAAFGAFLKQIAKRTHKLVSSLRIESKQKPSQKPSIVANKNSSGEDLFEEEKDSIQVRDPLPFESNEDEMDPASADENEFEEQEARRPAIRLNSDKAAAQKAERARPKASKTADEVTDWQLPPMALLQSAKTKIKGPTEEQLLATAERITNALRSFDIEGEVVEVSPGPIITMYEFQPAPGVRVNKLVSAQTDLAMTLGVPSVRVVAPIPGKCVAGIEVPNPQKQEIVLKDVFESTKERAKSMKLPLVFGVDNEGSPVVEDLARMPHLLIGGATNMGKSVLVNSILTGLLCRFTPEELKLIVVDPKLVEFKVFEDIPHLLLPIVNDPSDASQALKWAVGETKRRYLEMQKFAAKNLEAYNKKVGENNDKKGEKFPYILIIIDELAELMLTAKKDVEQSIVRLSQLARAAGIHLIMATQRPSADVVTGLIKSNCPSRAALRVASASDSRIILDCSGAEQLLGRGDMFFTNAGPMGLRRMQGSYVSDEEIERVCDFWREQGEPSYREEILAPEDDAQVMSPELDEETDALFNDVLEFAREKGKVSTSLIQRRFQIGYTRAARIMDQLEQRGFVGEAAAAGKPRDVIL